MPNNLKLITAPIGGTKTATILIIIGTGSKYENKTTSGISHFLEHMLFKGTKKRPTALAISSELDSLGGEYNAFTGKEYIGFWIKVEASRVEEAIAVLADIIFNSKLDDEEIEHEKKVIIEELHMYLDNPLIYIENLFEQCLYGNTPAGWDTIGRKENILKFRRNDLVNYFKSQVVAGNSLICLTGNLKQNRRDFLEVLIRKYFSSFSTGQSKNKLTVIEKQKEPQIKIYFKETDQAHLCLGVRGLAFSKFSETILRTMAILLGGSMSSRLFTELRERRGLAYYVRSQVESYTDSGYLVTQAGVPLDKINLALKVILDEYKKLKSQPVLKSELNKVKKYLIGRTTLQLEASDSVASWYGRQAILLLGQAKTMVSPNLKKGFLENNILTPEEYYKEIKRISSQDIQKLARQIFIDNKLNLAVIGPYKKTGEFEKILKF